MQTIKNMSLKMKLALMLLLPVLGVLFLSGSSILEKLNLRQDLTTLQVMAEIQIEAGHLVHELQIERGLSAAFLSSNTAEGKERLAQQQNNVDDSIANFKKFYLNTLDNQNINELDKQFRFFEKSISKLPNLRLSVTNNKVTVDSEVKEYTAIIESIYQMILHMIHLSPNAEISRQLSTYIGFIQAKDIEGQLRALISAMLGSRQFIDDRHRKALTLIGKRESRYNGFTNFADNVTKDFFEKETKKSEYAKAQDLEEAILTSISKAQTDISVEYWFETMTNRINLLQEIEEKIEGNLNQKIRQLRLQATQELIIINLACALLIVFSLVLILILTRSMLTPLYQIKQAAYQVINGNTDVKIESTSTDEIGTVASAFNEMLDSLHRVSRIAESIAVGDYSVEYKEKNEKDRLGIALKNMIKTLRELTVVAESVANEDFTVEVPVKSEQDKLGQAINHMVTSLKQSSEAIHRENWLKSGQNELADKTRGDQDLVSLCQNIISYLAHYLDCPTGLFYISEQDETMNLKASYAHSNRKKLANTFKPGESLVGQTMVERETIIISDVPDDYIKISSGLGEVPPRNILVTPLIYDKNVLGVIELGSLKPFTEDQITFIKSIGESIAIVIASNQSREKLNILLEETQRQSEELQTQQEELKAANEELEEQTSILKESEEKLKIQSEELQASNEELEEKTQELETQKSKIEKQKQDVETAKVEVDKKARELELASKYKSEFLANMSHELRTPLNSLLILAKMLSDNEEGNLTEEQQESAEVIYSGGKDLLNLINDILDLSKVEAGKLDVHIENVNIESICQRMKEQFSPISKDKAISFDIRCERDIPTYFKTDGKRIEQILKNLLGNAFKFTEQGGVELLIGKPKPNISFKNTELSSKASIEFSIVDSGTGIPDDKKELIFESFQQVDGSTNRRYAGTGLGLAISRQLVHLLGGEIQMQSEVGKGSTFSVYLPVDTVCHAVAEDTVLASTPQPEENNTIEISDTENPASNPTRIAPPQIEDDRQKINPDDNVMLIIEDDINFSKHLMKLARQKLYKCLAASTGKEGITLAKQYRPSGIILDVGLPDIDGLKVLDSLKYDLVTRDIPIYIVSARDKDTTPLKKGAVGFLTKPAEETELESVFKKIEETVHKEIKAILVVEDDKDNRAAVSKLVKSKGVKITESASGQDAYDKLSNQHFDCVILDLGLPDMTGFELLRQLEENESIDHIPVIIYTGRELTKDEHKELNQYTGSIVVKGANSPERLLDEASLFLHNVDKGLHDEQRKKIQTLHDPEEALRDKKVLLVDDDMRNTFALANALRKYGVDVVMADNGQMALEKLQDEDSIELAIMDIMMPVMDGYEAMREIRKKDEFKNMPVIALTAKAMAEDRAKCIEAGANDYLTKPVDVDTLVSMMRVWLYQS